MRAAKPGWARRLCIWAVWGMSVGIVGPIVGATEPGLVNQPQRVKAMLDRGELGPGEVPNPHWKEDACGACHADQGRKVPELAGEDINALCNRCHENDAIGAYIHAVGMPPPDDFVQRMPEGFRDAIQRGGGDVTCIACHDLPMQCDPKRREERGLNPRFFRGGPYRDRTDICFNCHNPKRYERYNPHDQITDEGDLDTQTCFVCHSVTPKRAKAQNIDDVRFNQVGNLENLCTGCHPWRPHPGGNWAGGLLGGGGGQGPDHLTVPPEPILERLKEHREEENIVMPLEPGTGRVFCATCHNPHERGVQYRHRADKGADGVRRLRRGRLEICTACHDK